MFSPVMQLPRLVIPVRGEPEVLLEDQKQRVIHEAVVRAKRQKHILADMLMPVCPSFCFLELANVFDVSRTTLMVERKNPCTRVGTSW
jgi:hypothetical protein